MNTIKIHQKPLSIHEVTAITSSLYRRIRECDEKIKASKQLGLPDSLTYWKEERDLHAKLLVEIANRGLIFEGGEA